MTQHTPEPWYLTSLGAGSIVCAEKATPLEPSPGLRCLDVVARTDWGRGKEDEANARRIVAAVNALQGVPTDYLERLKPGALADVIEGLID